MACGFDSDVTRGAFKISAILSIPYITEQDETRLTYSVWAHLPEFRH
jgi:hypothetical protein